MAYGKHKNWLLLSLALSTILFTTQSSEARRQTAPSLAPGIYLFADPWSGGSRALAVINPNDPHWLMQAPQLFDLPINMVPKGSLYQKAQLSDAAQALAKRDAPTSELAYARRLDHYEKLLGAVPDMDMPIVSQDRPEPQTIINYQAPVIPSPFPMLPARPANFMVTPFGNGYNVRQW